MWEDVIFKEVSLDFFDGIEDNCAFCFIPDENGKFVPVKETKYHLFESDIYPFVIYEDELRALNQYCYETAQTVKRYIDDAADSFQSYARMDESEFDTEKFTKYEMMMSCQEETYLCERIAWHSSSHMVALFHSFLERALKKLWTDLFSEREKAAPAPESHVKLYKFIERIFGIPISEFGCQSPEIYQQLEMVRKYRNQVIHGQFRTDGVNEEYEEGNELPPFRLIELIELVSSVLDLVELQYLALTDTKE